VYISYPSLIRSLHSIEIDHSFLPKYAQNITYEEVQQNSSNLTYVKNDKNENFQLIYSKLYKLLAFKEIIISVRVLS
jgi:hypothetical protein